MNFDEIKEVTLGYADREDQEVISKIPVFIKLVEARLNRRLKISPMSRRSVTITVSDQEYYSLPPDFAGLRDIEIRDNQDSVKRRTMTYVSPEMSNKLSGDAQSIYYTIVANQLQIIPRQDPGMIIEVIYYKKITPLTSTTKTNEISEQFPDLYVYGILVEINSFIKDKLAADAWDSKFQSVIEEVITDDSKTRWSGPYLEMKYS